jgi:poly-beta-1,6-N-acetyl-D-glucosamine synthase
MRTIAWLAFLSAGFFFVYALALYPLLLYVIARRAPRRVSTAPKAKTVTVLLPVHNGEQWIRGKLESILALDYPHELMRVIVISDGSTDATEAIAREFSRNGVEVVAVPKGGKPLAINKGMALADGEILFFTDVRQKLDRDCLRRLIANFADPDVGAACGELIILDGHTQEEQSVGLYWKVEKWIRRQLSRSGTLLVITGCVYAVRRDAAEPVPPDVLGDDIFIPQAVLRKGYRVVFEEDAKAYDYPTSRDVEFHRKVRTLAGLYQFVRRRGLGPYPFHFFSYKVSRLLLPYALLIIAVSSPFLTPAPVAIAVVAAQLLFYGLAALDNAVPDGSFLKKISSPARTFCMLMAASLRSVSVLFVPAANLWKTTHVRAAKTQGGT